MFRLKICHQQMLRRDKGRQSFMRIELFSIFTLFAADDSKLIAPELLFNLMPLDQSAAECGHFF
jgi:hypothetical protein